MNETSGRKRTAARLAAVQALYQIELTGADPDAVVTEFRHHRLGKDEENLGDADADFFIDLVLGASKRIADIDTAIGGALSPDWPLARLEAVLRALLRCGCYELANRRDVPPQIAINEYLDIAHAFFDGKEPGMVNGVLDTLARRLRLDEMENRRGAAPASR